MTENKNFKLVSASLRELVSYQWQKEINPKKCIYLVISSVIGNNLDGSNPDVFMLTSAVPGVTALHKKHQDINMFKNMYMTQLERAVTSASIGIMIKKAILEHKDLILVCGDGNEEGIDYLSVVREYITVRYKVRTAAMAEMMKSTAWARERMKQGKVVPDYTGNTELEQQEIVNICSSHLSHLDELHLDLAHSVNVCLNDHRIAIASLKEAKEKKKQRKKMKKKLKHMTPAEAYGWSFGEVVVPAYSEHRTDIDESSDYETMDDILSAFDY